MHDLSCHWVNILLYNYKWTLHVLPTSSMSRFRANTNLEFARTHIDNYICLTKGNPYNYVVKQKRVLIRLRDVGLTVMHTSHFSVRWGQNTSGMFYPEMVSNNNKKSTVNLTLTLMQNVEQLHRFLGEVQYYKEM